MTAALAHGSPAVRVHAKRYTDPAGWRLTYPSGFRLERADSGPGLAEFSEVTIASFTPSRGVQSGKTADGGFIHFVPPTKHFPDDAVALRIWAIEGGPAWIDEGPDSRFPLTLASFTEPDIEMRVPRARDRSIVANGLHYTATVMIGRHASAQMRAALARMISSLRFPSQHPGMKLGQNEFVLQTPDRYPPGSFTLLHLPGEVCDGSADRCQPGVAPFYLVHANWPLARNVWHTLCGFQAGACVPMGSFYLLGWKTEYVLGGYTSKCQMRLDRQRQQFYCANFDARWDRFGRTLRRPRWAHVNDNLAVSTAKISWAGFVLVVV